MDDVERVTPLRGVDDAGEMALRRPSSDRRDGDVTPAERAEQCPDDGGLLLRACADESDDRLMALPTEDHRTLPKLGAEFTTDRPRGRGGLAAVHHQRHQTRRRRLARNESRARDSMRGP